MKSKNLIEIKSLSCGYCDKTVLENIDISMNKGELWCVMGANGAGKSTFFKTTLGLLPKKSGNIYLNGKSIDKWSIKELSKFMAYVPQNHMPPFSFKVYEMVAMGRQPYQKNCGILTSEDERIIDSAIRCMNIEYMANRDYTKISGGERQLVLLARAIAQETPVLFLDEPVSNLDFGNHAKLISYIRKFVHMGKLVIMTTHDPDHAFLPESNVLIIKDNKIMLKGYGKKVIDEKIIKTIYNVDNHIYDFDNKRKTCIADI